eukprot:4731702-Amphidinium_carterae.1
METRYTDLVYHCIWFCQKHPRQAAAVISLALIALGEDIDMAQASSNRSASSSVPQSLVTLKRISQFTATAEGPYMGTRFLPQ